MEKICEAILSGVRKEFSCEKRASDGSFVITTPLEFPDGGAVQVFVKPQGEELVLTDFGKVRKWLYLKKTGRDLTEREIDNLNRICSKFDVSASAGPLIKRVEPSEISREVMRFASCIVRAADISLGFRHRSNSTADDDFAKKLEEWEIDFSRNHPVDLDGDSYRVDFEARISSDVVKLIEVLSAKEISSANGKADKTFAQWFSMIEHGGYDRSSLISVVDDRELEWSTNRVDLLSEVSRVAWWTQSNEMRTTIMRVR